MSSQARRALGAVTRRFAFARRYRSRLAWLGSYADAVLRAFSDRALEARLSGLGAMVPVRLRALAQPLFVRLGTSDWFVLEEVFLRDVYEPACAQFDVAPERVVDLGANIGLTLRLWHARWPRAELLAVEPDLGNLRVLRRNLDAAGCARSVQVVQACAVGRARAVWLERTPLAAAAFRVTDAPAGAPVNGYTMRELLDAAGWARVDLLKCDIEGAEAELFATCSEWIDRVRVLVVELHGEYRADMLERDLRANGGSFQRVLSLDPQLVIMRAG